MICSSSRMSRASRKRLISPLKSTMFMLSDRGLFSFRSATPCEKAFKHVASAFAFYQFSVSRTQPNRGSENRMVRGLTILLISP